MPNEKILIVEDDNLISWEIKDILEHIGYRVPSVVISGEEALSAVGKVRPDLVLMDIRIEGSMDGIETAKQIRKRHDVPIIYLTAHSDESTLERAKITEPHAYLLKPFNERDLHTSIEMALYKHKIESKLREHDRWLSMTMESIKDGIITTDTQGRVTFINSATESLIGRKADEVLGKDVWSFLQICSADEVFNQGGYDDQELLVSDMSSSSMLINMNGEEIPILYFISSIIDERGTTLGTVITIKDITKLKRMESELNRIHRMDAIATLAGGIAHDFNNLMTAVQMSAELTLLELESSNPLRTSFDEILKLTNQASKLTNQLLLISQRHPAKPIEIDLNEKIQDLSTYFSDIVNSKIDIRYELDPELKAIHADENNIELLLTNLISHEDTVMPNGGLLTLRTHTVLIEDETESTDINCKPGQYACISCIDNGPGLDEEAVEHIFEPFYSKSKLNKGAGLRLATVYGIIKQLNGWADVKSMVGKGTAFHIYLPLTTGNDDETDKSATRKMDPHQTGQKILVVEDEEQVRIFIGKALERNGYEIQLAGDSEEATDLFKKEPESYDLLLSDVVLPRKNGLELADELTNLVPELKVLLCSGYASDNNIRGEIQSKAYPFLRKPFKVSELLHKIRTILASKPA